MIFQRHWFKVWLKALRYYQLALTLLISLTVSLLFIQFYLRATARQFGADFYHQNHLLLNSKNIFELSYRLNNLSSSLHWGCAEIWNGTQRVYDQRRINDCSAGLFQTVYRIKGPSSTPGSPFFLEVTILLPPNLKLLLIFFTVTQTILLGLFFWSKHQRDRKWKQVIQQIINQVIHDIKSPLAAIQLLAVRDPSPILSSAYQRIEGILSDLSSDHQMPSTDQGGAVLLFPLIEEVLAEKRLYFEKCFLESHLPIDQLHRLCLQGDYSDVARLLSNLLNNAIEATEVLPLTTEKKIKIELQSLLEEENKILVKIIDNGRGIEQDILRRLQQQGGTFGKPSGQGLGLSSSKSIVQSLGGTLELESQVGLGTTVHLTLPSIQTRHLEWLCTSINFSGHEQLWIIDDDVSIHETWKLHHNQHQQKITKLVFFLRPAEALKAIDQKRNEKILLLLDYQFHHINIRETEQLLNVVKKNTNIKVIFCTSHYQVPAVQHFVQRHSISLLPKCYLPLMTFSPPPALALPHKKQNKKQIVLIDDDPLVHLIWSEQVQEENSEYPELELLSFRSLPGFLNHLQSISPERPSTMMPIFIDRYLGGECGLKVGQELFQQFDFSQLYLCSGLPCPELPTVFKGQIQGKSFPKELLESLYWTEAAPS